MGEGLTSGAGGVGEEGGVGFSFMDQEEQGRKAANERRVCSHADRSWPLGRGESPFCVSFMDLKKSLIFPLLSQTYNNLPHSPLS